MLCDRRLKVLALAPFCDGTDVGESWSVHQWISGLSRHHDITLLCLRRAHRPSAVEQLPGVEVVEWPDWSLASKLERLDSMMKPGYVAYYLRARRWMRDALRSGRRFDLAHQVAPLAIRYPSPVTGLGIPYIIGPLGGSLSTPVAWASECAGATWYSRLRGLDSLRLRLDPLLRRSLSGASVVLGVAPYVKDLLDGIPIRRFEVMSETGIVGPPPSCRERGSDPRRLRLLYVGRVIRTKGLRDAIRAMALLPDASGVTLDAVGAGDDLEACRREAAHLGVVDRVHFHGKLPREQVERFYEQADAFVFPSFREPSGNVVFEAMRHGLPLIVADRGGPGYAVDRESGIRISITDPSRFAADLAQAIESMRDPMLRRQLGNGARARVEKLAAWGTKIAWMSRLYECVASESWRPDYGHTKTQDPRRGVKRRSLDPAPSPEACVCGP